MDHFELVSDFTPQGDQPQAIEKLVDGIKRGEKFQTLLGVTGSGKTFTMANIIAAVNRPTIVLAHNKTLAAQLCSEFKEFFPNNCVEFFVSYYDYYQPEAYIPQTDTYIEKNSMTNENIDKLRHSATFALFERRDTLIVASVSCIYGLGDPEDYKDLMLSVRVGMTRDRDDMLRKLTEMQYERNDINFVRNKFRVRGDVVEVFPSNNGEHCIRIEFFGDEIDRSHGRDHRHDAARGHYARLALRYNGRKNEARSRRDLRGNGGAGKIFRGQKYAYRGAAHTPAHDVRFGNASGDRLLPGH